MAIFDNLSTETMKCFGEYMEQEKEDFELYIKNEEMDILGIIHELKATRHIIAKKEYEYEHAKHEYECNMIRTKNSRKYVEQYKTLKQREENATIEHANDAENIMNLKLELARLKANRDGLEDELRMIYRTFDLHLHEQKSNDDGDNTCSE